MSALLLRGPTDEPHGARPLVWLMPLLVVGFVVVAMLGFFMAIIGGGGFGCLGGGGQQTPPSRAAVADIPRARLLLYRQAGRRFRIEWVFLASIGAQECHHGSCRGDNGYGCAGPMQIAMRRGSPCSPGSGPTLWELYAVDGNGDGDKDYNDPADAIPTAARVLRVEKDAPPTGGTYDAYYQAACRYYGACGDGLVPYADEVMSRAVMYGFRGDGSPDPADAERAQPAPAQEDAAASCASASTPVGGAGSLGRVLRLREPRRLAPLPNWSIEPGYAPISCDERIIANTLWIARRYSVRVTACYGIHAVTGEHPLGAALDLTPADGNWNHPDQLARDLGWNAGCALSGVAPACARAPFRFIGWHGFPGHGSPATCACDAPHLHISWNTSASLGQPENAARGFYFAPSWIDVFATGGGDG
jgi:hypothetical protein